MIGLAIDAALLVVFYRDLFRLKRNHLNGGDEILNGMYIGVGWIAVGMHLATITVGIAGGNSRNSQGGEGPAISPVTFVITGGLFVFSLLAVCMPGWVLWRRRVLRGYLRTTAGTMYLTHLLARTKLVRAPVEGLDHGNL